MKKTTVISLILALALINGVVEAQQAQSSEDAQESSARDGVTVIERGNVQLREVRVGGRLEEVYVEREKGLNEIYQNRRVDTQWAPVETELGERQNMRQWKITGW